MALSANPGAGEASGSIIIRDLRLWHAGMPNKTEEPRVMLAICGATRVVSSEVENPSAEERENDGRELEL